MVKKTNEDAVAIKSLINRGYRQKTICKILGIKKQKVSYWANNEIKTTTIRKRKLPQKYIDKI